MTSVIEPTKKEKKPLKGKNSQVEFFGVDKVEPENTVNNKVDVKEDLIGEGSDDPSVKLAFVALSQIHDAIERAIGRPTLQKYRDKAQATKQQAQVQKGMKEDLQSFKSWRENQ